MIKITIYIDDSLKEFDYLRANTIFESLSDHAVSMEIEKISSRVTFERDINE